MPYIVFVTLLLVAASGIFSLYRQLQILQKSSYSLTTYLKKMKESYTYPLALSSLMYCAIMVSLMRGNNVLALMFSVCILFVKIISNITTQKAPATQLAFTARVKRLYIAAIILLGVLVFVSTVLTNSALANIFRMVCLLLSIIVPILTCAVWAITLPIEKRLSTKNKKEKDFNDDVAN